ncbi:phosphotransferase [Paenibacillus oryzisoli]|uniref:phosphotransferase n=1 Tax=Paenibacillus oryzisoli TaxID=1850517 RepID=UPI003D2DED0C
MTKATDVVQMDDELKALIEEIYGLMIARTEVLHDTSRTLVVKLETEQGTYLLKSIYVSEARVRFMLDCEQFLRGRGIRIPAIRKARGDQLFFSWKWKHYVLQEWIAAVPWAKSPEEMAVLMAGLAGQVHFRSKSYRPDEEETDNGLLLWEREYEDVQAFLARWREEGTSVKKKNRKAVRKQLDFFLAAAGEVQERLTTRLSDCALHGALTPVISHNDFHTKNVLITAQHEAYLIDWEFVRLDGPSRDLNRILHSLIKKTAEWNADVFERIKDAYMAEHPLSEEELRFVYLDLAFPHNLYRYLYWKRFDRMPLERVQCILEAEAAKTAYFLQEARISCHDS